MTEKMKKKIKKERRVGVLRNVGLESGLKANRELKNLTPGLYCFDFT
jgi:hypothetical protein